MSQVACLGIMVADVVGKPIEAFPAKGTLSVVDRMELHAGGCAANTAIGLAKLGVGVSVLGKIGSDGFGEFLLATMQRAGVETGGVIRSETDATSATMVAVDAEGERTFLHYPGANATFDTADIDQSRVQVAQILHIAGPFLMPRFIGESCADILRRAHERGQITTLDTVWDFTERWMTVLAPSLPYLDYALPSWEEGKRITGRDAPQDIAQVLLDLGVKTVAVKLGSEGAYVKSANGASFTMPPFRVNAIDALGAGDAWSAGFITGVTHGWELEQTARFANAVGACSVQALGATTGIRSFEETLAFMKDADE